jgi:hypothetical protein
MLDMENKQLILRGVEFGVNIEIIRQIARNKFRSGHFQDSTQIFNKNNTHW